MMSFFTRLLSSGNDQVAVEDTATQVAEIAEGSAIGDETLIGVESVDGDRDVVVCDESSDDNRTVPSGGKRAGSATTYKHTILKPLTREAHEYIHAPTNPGGLVPIGFFSMDSVRKAANWKGGCTDTPDVLQPCDFVRLYLGDHGDPDTVEKYLPHLEQLTEDVLDQIVQNKGQNGPQTREEVIQWIITRDGFRRVKVGTTPEVALYLMVFHGGKSVEEALNELGFTEERLQERLKIEPLTLEELQLLVCPDGDQPVTCSYRASEGKDFPFMPIKGAIIDPERAVQRNGAAERKVTDLIAVDKNGVEQWLGCGVEMFDPASGEKSVATVFGTAIYLRSSKYSRGGESVPRELFPQTEHRATMMFDGSPNSLGRLCQALFKLRREHDRGFEKCKFRHWGFVDCNPITAAIAMVDSFNKSRAAREEQERVDRAAATAAMDDSMNAFINRRKAVVRGNTPFAAAGQRELGSAANMTQFSSLLKEGGADAKSSGDDASRAKSRREERRRQEKERRRRDSDDE